MQQCMFVVVVPYEYEVATLDSPPYVVGSTGCSNACLLLLYLMSMKWQRLILHLML